jgi:hypothetical protein
LQAFEREMLVHLFQIARAGGDQVRLPAGGDDLRLRSELLPMMRSRMPSIMPTGPEVQARLHAGHGVGADYVLRRAEIHQRQARGLW